VSVKLLKFHVQDISEYSCVRKDRENNLNDRDRKNNENVSVSDYFFVRRAH